MDLRKYCVFPLEIRSISIGGAATISQRYKILRISKETLIFTELFTTVNNSASGGPAGLLKPENSFGILLGISPVFPFGKMPGNPGNQHGVLVLRRLE